MFKKTTEVFGKKKGSRQCYNNNKSGEEGKFKGAIKTTATSCNTKSTDVAELEPSNRAPEEELLEVSQEDHDFNKSDNTKDDGKIHRGWALTIWPGTSYTSDKKGKKIEHNELDNFKSEKCRYKISTYEICPTTGNPHYQSFIYFEGGVTFNRMKKKYPTAHLGFARKCALANSRYCKKPTSIIEIEEGTIPQQGGGVLKCDELKKMSVAEIIEHDSRSANQYIKCKKLLESYQKPEDWFKSDFKVYYIDGQSESGKSFLAKQMISKYIKEQNGKYGTHYNEIFHEDGFFHQFTSDCSIAFWDDYRPSDIKASQFIKLIDYNKHPVNVKGSTEMNNYKLIFITSVVPLLEIYQNVEGEPRKQWLRRMTHINIEKGHIKFTRQYYPKNSDKFFINAKDDMTNVDLSVIQNALNGDNSDCISDNSDTESDISDIVLNFR